MPVGVEVWCLNNVRAYMLIRRMALREWTRWFNVHSIRHFKTRHEWAYQWLQRKDGTRPVYLQEMDPTVPGCVVFPRAQIQSHFKTRFFTSTGAWLIALAIMEGFERIELWGYDMPATSDHAYQRPCFAYWVEQARKAGVEVVIPRGAFLGPAGDNVPPGNPDTYTGPLYGYEPHTPWYAETF